MTANEVTVVSKPVGLFSAIGSIARSINNVALLLEEVTEGALDTTKAIRGITAEALKQQHDRMLADLTVRKALT